MAVSSVSGTDPLPTLSDNYKRYAPYFGDEGKSELTMQNFFSLLMAEMTHQDPMEPMSNTEFVSQMATFTALQAQQDALYFSNANYAQSLVGKEVLIAVTAKDGKSIEQTQGSVESMRMKGSEFFVTVGGTEFPLKSIVKVIDGGTGSSLSQDEAYAAQLIGYQVSVAATTSSGEVFFDTGIVSHVEVQDGTVMVVVNGYAFKLSDIVKVELPNFDNPEDTDGTGTGTDGTGTDIGTDTGTGGTETGGTTAGGVDDAAAGGGGTGTGGTTSGGVDDAAAGGGGTGSDIPANDPGDVP